MKASELKNKLGARKQKTTSELKQVISTGSAHNPNYCLFLGAGASRSSGIRTAGEMIEQWRREVYAGLSGNSEPCSTMEMKEWLSTHAQEWYESKFEYASLIERIYPLAPNRRKFFEQEVSNKTPSIGYAYLVRIAEAGRFRTIFTTNFDDLLNEAFYQFSSERALVCAHDSAVHSISITAPRTKIIKLHGDYLFDALKNTTSETEKLETNMRAKLEEFLKEYGLIIAGYSGADASIMRIIRDMDPQSPYLQNGLYWCLRESDEVNDNTLEILKRQNSFYVLTPGFDELMADLYSMLGTDATPFNSKLASNRAAGIIESYLQNDHLKSSPSETIKKHLRALEDDKNATLLTDLLKELNAESIASAGLTEKHLLVCLEIERTLQDRNPEAALSRLNEELAKTNDNKFKEILLARKFVCTSRLNRFREARDTLSHMLSLEPENYLMSLNVCSLMEKREQRIEYLSQLKERHPYCAPVLNQYAAELSDAFDNKEKLSDKRVEDVYNCLKSSTEINPSIHNRAWSQLFSYHSIHLTSPKNRRPIEDIIDIHLSQDPFDDRTSAMLLRYCRKFKTVDYKGRQLLTFLEEAYNRHFPRNYSAHLGILVEACIEFEGHKLLRPLLEKARTKEELRDDPQFTAIMMEVHYDVFRDLREAIALGQNFLRKNKSTSIQIRTLRLLLQEGQFSKARECHASLRGAIDQGQLLRLEADILERETRYQDAIDTIEALPDRRDFDEKYCSHLAFLELKMGDYDRAVKRCYDFLSKRSFAPKFETAIINYEFGKAMSGKKKVDKSRVQKLAEATDNPLTQAVCYSLLGEDTKALEIIRKRAELRFSEIDECMQWPAISRHQKPLSSMREELLKRKRILTDLATNPV